MFFAMKYPGRETYNTPPSSAEGKSELSYTVTPHVCPHDETFITPILLSTCGSS